MGLIARLFRGALAGINATALMSLTMLGAKRVGALGAMPPEKITSKFLNAHGIARSRKQQDALATALHFGFGAGAGAVFGVVAPRAPVARIPLGIAYGAAIWGVSYAGWIPGLGIMPPPLRDRKDRQAAMLAGHLIYGAALGILVGRREKPGASDAREEDGAVDRDDSAMAEAVSL
jgi:hypothetical protein